MNIKICLIYFRLTNKSNCEKFHDSEGCIYPDIRSTEGFKKVEMQRIAIWLKAGRSAEYAAVR